MVVAYRLQSIRVRSLFPLKKSNVTGDSPIFLFSSGLTISNRTNNEEKVTRIDVC